MKLNQLADNGKYTRLAILGQISQRELGPLREPLGESIGQEAFARPVLLDLGGVTFVDSSGVGWLLSCHKRLKQAGGKLVLHSCPPVFQSVAKILRLDQVLEMVTDEPQAIATCQSTEVIA